MNVRVPGSYLPVCQRPPLISSISADKQTSNRHNAISESSPPPQVHMLVVLSSRLLLLVLLPAAVQESLTTHLRMYNVCTMCTSVYALPQPRNVTPDSATPRHTHTRQTTCIQWIFRLSNHAFYATMRSGQLLTAAIAHTRTYTHYCCGTKDPTRSLGSYYAECFPGPATTVITVRFTVRSIYSTHQVVHVQVRFLLRRRAAARHVRVIPLLVATMYTTTAQPPGYIQHIHVLAL